MDIYATPKNVTDINQCLFYHTVDIPGIGYCKGQWDLRKGAMAYLGNVDLEGKRVLEIGAADGFLSFFMEGLGAEVVAYDLSEKESWDIVPYSNCNYQNIVSERKLHIEKINNAFWLARKAFQSKVKMVHGTVYAIPEEIGEVDVSIFASVLLHVRDPFLALQNALRLTRETVVVTELRHFKMDLLGDFFKMLLGKYAPMHFSPDFHKLHPQETWWYFTPEIIRKFIGVLGFTQTKTFCHYQKSGSGKKEPFITIVGHRTHKG